MSETTPATPSHRQVDLVLQSLDELPTLSPVAVRLLRLTGSQDADFEQIIKLIESDPALSAKVLSLVRKAGVGAARAVTTVKRAAVMLGLEAVQSAVLSVQIYELLNQAPGGDERREQQLDAFDRAGFWKHSIGVGCAAEMLARQRSAISVAPDEAFVAGLVHDLGKLALDWVLPKTYDRVIRQAVASGRTLHAAERTAIGVDHHQAGKRLAERWSLPHQLQDAMWLHGQPPGATPDLAHRNLIGVVAIANGLVHRMMIGWNGCGAGGGGVGGVSANALIDAWAAELGYDPQDLAAIELKLHDAVAERCQLLGIGEQTPASMVVESITSANAKLSRLHDQVRIQSRAASGAARALALITEFAGSERPGGSLIDTLARIAKGWHHLTGRGPLAIVCQTRASTSGAAEPWRFVRCDNAGAVVEQAAIPAPASSNGDPLDLRHLSAGSGGSLGDAFEMAQWLSRRLGPGVPVSRLNTLALVSAMGPAAVIVHEPVEASSVSQQAMATITTVWSWAVGAAAQAEGARRIAENLAQTARELSETQARLADAESMARLGEFTSGAAHEMNNPLTVISGRAQTLAEKLRDPKQKEDAAAIVRAADALTDLVTQLHTVASPPRPATAPVRLKSWAQNVVAEARKRAGSAVSATMPVRIEAIDVEAVFDGPQIARAAVELVVNALQSQPKTGVILRVRPADLSPQTDERQLLRISVIDDGRGMSEYTRKHACDPFFSSLPAGRRPGLGLALAKRLIEASGGELEIESKPDRGTTAVFALQTETGAPAAQSDRGPRPPLGRAA